MHDGGVYAQDRWTVKRLTLNLGVRCDYYRTNSRRRRWDRRRTRRTRNVTFPAGDLASFNDITPKIGVAYDLFGNGRTALKVSSASTSSSLPTPAPMAIRPTRRSGPRSS